MKLSTLAANAMLNAVRDLVDAGAAAKLKFYDGTVPATVATALTTQNLLATATLADPCAGAAASRVLTFTVPFEDASVDVAGTTTFARLEDSTGVVVAQLTCGTSGTDIVLVTAALVVGQPLEVTSMTFTAGN